MKPKSNDPWGMAYSQLVAHTTGGGGWSGNTNSNNPLFSKFSIGDRIVLLSGVGTADSSPRANPIWGVNSEYIAGTVVDITRSHDMLVRWDNNLMNIYNPSDAGIELFSAVENKPRKGKIFGGQKLDTTQLDALVIDPEIKTEIIALLQQHKHGNKLFDEWGLGEVIEYGRGMTLMFHGGPGTGKTFGARCIAKALGKELLIIGAAEIQSSEPGGASRSIQQAFATAKEEDKVLFIDECDSLIANRANLGMILASEINTLLTEIEKAEGVVILATNRISDMDSALERRLSLIIEFLEPTLEQRLQIWKGLLPKQMPLHTDVTVEALAKYELTGGLIKNVVLQAARLALADGAKAVEMRHFAKAITRTTSSQGLMGQDKVQTDGMGVGVGVHRTVDVDNVAFSKFLDSDI